MEVYQTIHMYQSTLFIVTDCGEHLIFFKLYFKNYVECCSTSSNCLNAQPLCLSINLGPQHAERKQMTVCKVDELL